LTPQQPYPVIDVFAGPGGLGEGFASLGSAVDQSRKIYRIALSIEKDKTAQSTLMLRHFFRQFEPDRVPDDYYGFLANRISLDELYRRHPDESGRARESAWQCELGAEDNQLVIQRIRRALRGAAKWVLVGGPPCQAYSLAGRSRMKDQPGFVTDHRHRLYREYLRIIADHKPPVFVMENVKGLLSAQLDGTSTIELIMKDLQEPELAIYARSGGVRYRLYSLSTGDEVSAIDKNVSAFVVRSELYGIPQARHRIIVVGVKADLNVTPGKLVREPAVTVEQVIGDLPRLRSRISRGPDSAQRWHAELMDALKAPWVSKNDVSPRSSRLNGTSSIEAGEAESQVRFAGTTYSRK
jgi:DNA (cytosine-5)-methyltransferase 1